MCEFGFYSLVNQQATNSLLKVWILRKILSQYEILLKALFDCLTPVKRDDFVVHMNRKGTLLCEHFSHFFTKWINTFFCRFINLLN
jgi:hypothetical protein